MIAIAYYLLKVLICSAILFGYYHLALRNKLFHQWNRYYLLATVICSLLIPCLEFELFITHKEAAPIQLLQVVYSADEFVAEAAANPGFPLSAEQVIYLIYGFVSLSFFAALVLSLLRIYALIRSHTVQQIETISFVNTQVKGAPFSFLRFIFWNKRIDLNSVTGQQIFRHELVHVQEKHTIDKLFLQTVLCFFWCNPVFWLVRNELRMIHEFIADKKAVAESDASAFAAMILQAAYPQQSFTDLTNPFFQSPIKRRLTMLTKQHNHKISYASRVLALPLIAILALAFTIKTKTTNQVRLEKPLTVVIDAGHGGNTGARFENIYEDDLVLQLAKAVKEANANDKINVVFTRTSNDLMDLKERVAIAQRNNADLFISLHMNAVTEQAIRQSPNSVSSGIEVLVPSKNPPYQKQSELLGSALISELKTVYNNTSQNYQLGKTAVHVIDRNVCPSVLIECGYVTDKNDRTFMSESSNQKLIARKIITAIERYAASLEKNESSGNGTSAQSIKAQTSTTKSSMKDTLDNPIVFIDGVKKSKLKDLGDLNKLVPANEIESMFVYKDKQAIDKYGKDGKNGVIELITKKVPLPPPPAKPQFEFENALVIVDGVEKGRVAKKDDLNKLIPAGREIKTVDVAKDKYALEHYGEKGKYGVIKIETKTKETSLPRNEVQQGPTTQSNFRSATSTMISQQEEEPAEFPGGKTAWQEFLTKNIDLSVPSKNGAPDGSYTVILSFAVDEKGALSNIQTLTKHGYGMEQEVLKMMQHSPNWVPAKQNGHLVNSLRKQPVTFVIQTQ